MENLNKHVSTMKPTQRVMLLDILKHTHDMEKLAYLTDPELHELWIRDCEYPNPYKIL